MSALITETPTRYQTLCLPRGECLSLLRTHSLGRIAWLDASGHRVQPVYYRLSRRQIELRSAAVGPMIRLPMSSQVALEIDDLDPVTGVGWWVIATGRTATQGQAVTVTVEQCSGTYWSPIEPRAVDRIAGSR